MEEVLLLPGLVDGAEECGKSLIPAGSQAVEIGVSALDRAGKPRARVGLQAVPRRETRPAPLVALGERIDEPAHPLAFGGQPGVDSGTSCRPSEGGTERNGSIEVADIDDPVEHELDGLPPDGGNEPAHDVARDLATKHDRRAAEPGEPPADVFDAVRMRMRAGNELDEWQQLDGRERTGDEEPVRAAKAGAELARMEGPGTAGDHGRSAGYLLDLLEQALLHGEVLGCRFDDPVGILDRGEEAA